MSPSARVLGLPKSMPARSGNYVDRDCILGNLCIHGELTEKGIKEFLKQQELLATSGEFYSVSVCHRPEKK